MKFTSIIKLIYIGGKLPNKNIQQIIYELHNSIYIILCFVKLVVMTTLQTKRMENEYEKKYTYLKGIFAVIKEKVLFIYVLLLR